jgi:hypothetical protein
MDFSKLDLINYDSPEYSDDEIKIYQDLIEKKILLKLKPDEKDNSLPTGLYFKKTNIDLINEYKIIAFDIINIKKFKDSLPSTDSSYLRGGEHKYTDVNTHILILIDIYGYIYTLNFWHYDRWDGGLGRCYAFPFTWATHSNPITSDCLISCALYNYKQDGLNRLVVKKEILTDNKFISKKYINYLIKTDNIFNSIYFLKLNRIDSFFLKEKIDYPDFDLIQLN